MAMAARSMTCARVFCCEVSVQTEPVVSPTLPVVDFPLVARTWPVVGDGCASVQTGVVVPFRVSYAVLTSLLTVRTWGTWALVSERVLVDGSVSRMKGILVEEMEILPQEEMMSGVPQRAGKGTTGELVKDLVFLVLGSVLWGGPRAGAAPKWKADGRGARDHGDRFGGWIKVARAEVWWRRRGWGCAGGWDVGGRCQRQAFEVWEDGGRCVRDFWQCGRDASVACGWWAVSSAWQPGVHRASGGAVQWGWRRCLEEWLAGRVVGGRGCCWRDWSADAGFRFTVLQRRHCLCVQGTCGSSTWEGSRVRRGGTVNTTNEGNHELPSILSMCQFFRLWKRSLRWWSWFHRNACNNGSRLTTSLSSSANDSTDSAVAVHRQCRRHLRGGSAVAVHRHGWWYHCRGAEAAPPSIQTEIEALQFQVRAISCEIQGKTSGREEFLTKTNELRMQRAECSQQIHAFRAQTPRILGQVSDAEIGDLERNRPKVSEYNKNEKDMEGFDPSVPSNISWPMSTNSGVFGQRTRRVIPIPLLSCCLNIRTFRTMSKDFLIHMLRFKRRLQSGKNCLWKWRMNAARHRDDWWTDRPSQHVFVAPVFFFCTVVVCCSEEEERLFGHSCSECYLCWTDWDWLCDWQMATTPPTLSPEKKTKATWRLAEHWCSNKRSLIGGLSKYNCVLEARAQWVILVGPRCDYNSCWT